MSFVTLFTVRTRDLGTVMHTVVFSSRGTESDRGQSIVSSSQPRLRNPVSKEEKKEKDLMVHLTVVIHVLH